MCQTDREKAIEGLECCAGGHHGCVNCPYNVHTIPLCTTEMAKDVMKLMKELTENIDKIIEVLEDEDDA